MIVVTFCASPLFTFGAFKREPVRTPARWRSAKWQQLPFTFIRTFQVCVAKGREISASVFSESEACVRPVGGLMLSALEPARTVAVATMATDASRARTDGRFSNSAE